MRQERDKKALSMAVQVHKRSDTDVEKQIEWEDDPDLDNDSHLAVLKALFQFTPEQMRQIRSLPSPTYWSRHVEHCFQPLMTDQYASVWTTLGLPRPNVAAQCWNLFQAISETAAKLDDVGISIEDVWEATRPSSDPRTGPQVPPSPAAGRDDQSLVVVFAVLCWSSMIFQPEIPGNKAAVVPCLAVKQPPAEPQSLKMDFVHRPIPVVFRNFQKVFIHRRLMKKPVMDAGVSLFVSTINYHSLRTIGKVGLKWVDDLSCHLTFDSKSRTLSVFRLPSFCACTVIGGDRGVLFEELVRALFSTNEGSRDSECSNLQLSQEVLMSYRLLFGQSRSARKLGKSMIQKLGSKGQYDQLLICLCTKSQNYVNKQFPASFWPPTCRDFDGKLQEAESYNSQDDFPIFGCRLAALQDYNLRQQPSKLRDLWRDRRNPLQWYTFWAVLIVGGISNFVAILQLAVAIIQVFY